MERTERCQAAIEHARKSSRKLGQTHIHCSHFVLGLLSLEGGPARYTLFDAGLTPARVEEFITSRKEDFEKVTEVQGALFGKSALDILKLAEDEATRFHSVVLDAEHVLLALLSQKKGEAADLFSRSKVKRDKIADLLSLQLR